MKLGAGKKPLVTAMVAALFALSTSAVLAQDADTGGTEGPE